jgi:hypothetical protein
VAGTCGYGEELSGSINEGNFLTSCKVYWLASQEGLCSMEQVSKLSLLVHSNILITSHDTHVAVFIVLLRNGKRLSPFRLLPFLHMESTDHGINTSKC